MKDQQSCISVFVVYPTVSTVLVQIETRSISSDMTAVFYTWSDDRFIEIQSNLRRKELHRINQGTIFLVAVLEIEIM